jgi:hypothetical protein
MRRDVGDSTIGQNVLNSMGATMKQRTAAITIGILFWASGATADTVVVTAERMVDVLAGRTVMRPQKPATGYDQTPSPIQTNARVSEPSIRCQGVLARRLLRRGFRAGPS